MDKYERAALELGIEYLNQFPDVDGDWAGEYLLRAVTKFDSGKTSGYDGKEFFAMCRVMVFELQSDDEGGPSNVMLFLDGYDNIRCAVYGFDGNVDPMASIANTGELAYHIYPNVKLANDKAPTSTVIIADSKT